MSTAILSALPEEQSSLVQQLAHPQRLMHAGRAFWRGELHEELIPKRRGILRRSGGYVLVNGNGCGLEADGFKIGAERLRRRRH